VEDACGLGFNEPRACQPVEDHQGRDCSKGGANPADVGDQEGHDPLPDDSHQGEHSERDQGKKRQADEESDLGVDGEEPNQGGGQGAEEFIGVGQNRDGVTLGWAELVVCSALPWQLPFGPPSPDIPDMTVGRGDALLPHDAASCVLYRSVGDQRGVVQSGGLPAEDGRRRRPPRRAGLEVRREAPPRAQWLLCVPDAVVAGRAQP
jgi:hypothetical protein